jgi:hypothetical protein
MCKRNGESVDHLLLHYDVASTIWSAFFSCFGCPGLCLDVLLTCLIVGGSLRAKECCGVENGTYVPLLVFMEENE